MPPTSTEHSRALWKSDDAGEWRAALDAYDERLAALNHPKLLTLDSWFRHELPSAVRSRDPPRLLARELVELVFPHPTRLSDMGSARPRSSGNSASYTSGSGPRPSRTRHHARARTRHSDAR